MCALMPQVDVPTEVLLVVHHLERHRTTGTGRFCLRCLTRGRALVRGDPDRPIETPVFTHPAVVLFPSDDAQPLESFTGPLTLVVPDGNWTQAKRTPKRVSWMRDLPRARVDRSDRLSALRENGEGRMSTMEAISAALGTLEGPRVQRALDAALTERVRRHRLAKSGSP